MILQNLNMSFLIEIDSISKHILIKLLNKLSIHHHNLSEISHKATHMVLRAETNPYYVFRPGNYLDDEEPNTYMKITYKQFKEILNLLELAINIQVIKTMIEGEQ